VTEVRRDPLTGVEVVIAPERALRPQIPVAYGDRGSLAQDCPFCPGHEAETPAEVDSEGPPGRVPDTADWQVRVFANRYPAFERHEVLVFAPEHDAEMADLTDTQVALCLAVAGRRLGAFREDPDVAAVMFIVNEGPGAGASLEHPHGQLLGLPVAPTALRAEAPDTDGGACKVCAAVETERSGPRVVLDEGATAYCPWASAWPYEVVIAPPHLDPFEHSSPLVLYDVARVLRRLLLALRDVTGGAPYNLVVHSGMGHWHVHVVPRTIVVGGMELGSDLRVNHVDPDDAAAALRAAVRR
jgi:UDPglucose--hexose-1-phosphate uridylyltransferase